MSTSILNKKKNLLAPSVSTGRAIITKESTYLTVNFNKLSPHEIRGAGNTPVVLVQNLVPQFTQHCTLAPSFPRCKVLQKVWQKIS